MTSELGANDGARVNVSEHMDDTAQRARKRIRQACEPCRRKKGRCPGERPSCSLCTRLGQVCVYAGIARGIPLLDDIADAADTQGSSEVFPDPFSANGAPSPDNVRASSPHDLQRQMRSLDDKVTETLGHVRLMAALQDQTRLQLPDSGPGDDDRSSPTTMPSVAVMRKAIRLYIRFCHYQPLGLFEPSRLEETISLTDPEVQLCICGIALRFAGYDGTVLEQHTGYAKYLESAKILVMRRLNNGKIELSTLQSLCLLALADFNDGKHQQAGIYLGLASELARSASLELHARTTGDKIKSDEHIRCLWGIIMLQYLCAGFGGTTMVIDLASIWQPPSDASNRLAAVNAQTVNSSREIEEDVGIEAYATQMTEVWHRVRQYVHHRGRLDKHPPWSGQSVYSNIMFRQMEMESQMPHKHRFKPSGFATQSDSLLTTNRDYWAPWLYLQVIYHAIVCTLNHPLLLSNQMRRFRVNQIPELFLQSTADMMNTHTDWIIHLLDLAADKGFQPSDPFLGHCIAIIATVFLQQSYTDEPQKRAEKQAKYSTCLRFVQSLGKFWLHVDHMASDLQKLERTLSKAFEISALESSPNMSKYVDLGPFWRILDNAHFPSASGGPKSIFGASLTFQQSSQGEKEMLSARPVPEPTRVGSLPASSLSTAPTPEVIQDFGTTNGTLTGNTAGHGVPDDQIVDFPFLAQNIFALGQDFVGNAEDWFNWQGYEQLTFIGNYQAIYEF